MAHITINFRSNTINMPVMLDILLPQQSKECKTLYLLHGMGGDRESWLLRSRVADYAEEKQIAVVMPSGNNKFFINNRNGKAYQQFITEELPAQMELWFGVSKKAQDRFIAGADMGGFGAVLAAAENPESFHTAFSYHNAAYLQDMIHNADTVTKTIVFGTEQECEAALAKLNEVVSGTETKNNTMFVIYDQPEQADWAYLDKCLQETIGYIVSGGNALCQ